MMDPQDTPRGGPAPAGNDLSSLSDVLARSFMKRALPKARSPVEALVARMCEADGQAWFRGLVDGGFQGRVAHPCESLLEGQASLEDLGALKNLAKGLLKKARKEEARLRYALLYLLAIAAALVHHGIHISSHGAQELKPVFVELSALAPPGWANLFTIGAAKLGAL